MQVEVRGAQFNRLMEHLCLLIVHLPGFTAYGCKVWLRGEGKRKKCLSTDPTPLRPHFYIIKFIIKIALNFEIIV